MKKKYSAILIILILIIVIIPGDLNYLKSNNLSGFMIQNWSMNYDSGFIFRGLIGTILSLFTRPITPNLIMIITYVMIGLYILAVYLYSNSLYEIKKNDITLLFLLFILVQPSVLQKLITSSTVGRLDVIMTLLFLVMFLLPKLKRNLIKYTIAVLISALALLIHEGFFVFFVPTIFVMFLIFEEKIWRSICYYLLPVVLIWLCIVLTGQADIPLQALFEQLNSNAIANYGRDFNHGNLQMIYYMNIKEKIEFTLNFYDKTKLFKIALTFIVLSPSLYCLIRYYIALFNNTKDKKKKVILVLFYIATISPLGALLFGIDTYRWIGIALFNNCTALAILFYYDSVYRETIYEITEKIKHSLIVAIVLALLSGVFSVFNSYPFIEKYIHMFLG